MNRIVLYVAIFLYLSSTHAFAVKDIQKSFKGFQFFTNCEPISPQVGLQKSDTASNFGLTEESIQNAVESRLRSARLYSNFSLKLNSYLYVFIHVVGRAFNIRVEFKKSLYDQFSLSSTYATTWRQGITGTHSNNPGYILSSLSEIMDEFLVEFFRVNDEACRKKK